MQHSVYGLAKLHRFYISLDVVCWDLSSKPLWSGIISPQAIFVRNSSWTIHLALNIKGLAYPRGSYTLLNMLSSPHLVRDFDIHADDIWYMNAALPTSQTTRRALCNAGVRAPRSNNALVWVVILRASLTLSLFLIYLVRLKPAFWGIYLHCDLNSRCHAWHTL